MKNIRKKKKEPEIELFQAEKCIEPFRRLNEQLKFVWYKICNYIDVNNTNGFLPLFVDWVIEKWVPINKEINRYNKKINEDKKYSYIEQKEDVVFYYQFLKEDIIGKSVGELLDSEKSVGEWLDSFVLDCMYNFFNKEVEIRKITLPEVFTRKDIPNLTELLFPRQGFSINDFDKPELVQIYIKELDDIIVDYYSSLISVPCYIENAYFPKIKRPGHFDTNSGEFVPTGDALIDVEKDCKFSLMKLEDFKDLRRTLRKIQEYNQIPSFSSKNPYTNLWVF